MAPQREATASKILNLARDNSRRSGPYDLSAQEGSRRSRRGGGRGGSPRGTWAADPVVATIGVPHAKIAPQSKDSDQTSLCYRYRQTGYWAKKCRASQNVANTYKLYREAIEAHNMEQGDDDDNIKLQVDDFKDGKSDETPDFA